MGDWLLPLSPSLQWAWSVGTVGGSGFTMTLVHPKLLFSRLLLRTAGAAQQQYSHPPRAPPLPSLYCPRSAFTSCAPPDRSVRRRVMRRDSFSPCSEERIFEASIIGDSLALHTELMLLDCRAPSAHTHDTPEGVTARTSSPNSAPPRRSWVSLSRLARSRARPHSALRPSAGHAGLSSLQSATRR